jgi:hypothetical protein
MNAAGTQGFVARRDAFPVLALVGPRVLRTHQGITNYSMRYIGATSALAAVRDALFGGLHRTTAGGRAGATFFEFGPEMLDAIASAIGKQNYSLRPHLEEASILSFCFEFHVMPDECHALVAVRDPTGEKMAADFTLIQPLDAPEFDLVLVDGDALSAQGAAPSDLRHVANVASEPGFVTPLGFDRAALDAIPSGIRLASTELNMDGVNLRRDEFRVALRMTDDGQMPSGLPVLLLRSQEEPPRYAVIADGVGLAAFTFGEVHSGTDTTVLRSHDGKHWGSGGSLVTLAERAFAIHPSNWSAPLFDGFGLLKDWVPPTNSDLFGGSRGEDGTSYYLRNARAVADEATSAVRFAIENMIQERSDSQRLAASRERAEGIALLELASLCGSQSACDVSVESASFQPLECLEGANQYCDYVGEYLGLVLPRDVPLLRPVSEAIGVESAPPFNEYQGGELQHLALAQWRAWKAIDRILKEIPMQTYAAQQAVDAAEAAAHAARASQTYVDEQEQFEVERALDRIEYECNNPFIWDNAARSGFSSALHDDSTFKARVRGQLDMDDFQNRTMEGPQSYSEGPIRAQKRRCNDAVHEFGLLRQAPSGSTAARLAAIAAWEQAAAVSAQAWVGVSSTISTVMLATADLQESIASVSRALNGVGVRVARARLDAKVEQAGVASQLAVSRRYHQYDMWRARALLENARRLAVTARRALESRFVVDLSNMQHDEPFVAAPALWADEVYEYDLSPPAAVGLSRTPSADGLYPNKLSDYIGNLENFVRGYAVRRPTASALNDAEVVAVAGPTARQETEVEGILRRLPHRDTARWSFACREAGTNDWRSNPIGEELESCGAACGSILATCSCEPDCASDGRCCHDFLAACESTESGSCAGRCGEPGDEIVCSCAPDCVRFGTCCPDFVGQCQSLETVCDGLPPALARVDFGLDPWGRLDGSFASPPFVARHNVRAGRLAVNLVGTGVRDCTRAADALTCYAEPFVRFDLRQTGATWTTNFEGQWSALGFPGARVESGKALAAEEWLDPIVNGWSQSFVANVARYELLERPIGGTYTIDLEVTPDLRLDRIERVQVLTESSYWVAQR